MFVSQFIKQQQKLTVYEVAMKIMSWLGERSAQHKELYYRVAVLGWLRTTVLCTSCLRTQGSGKHRRLWSSKMMAKLPRVLEKGSEEDEVEERESLQHADTVHCTAVAP